MLHILHHSHQSAPHSSRQGLSRRHSPGVEHAVFPGNAQWHVNTSVPKEDIVIYSVGQSKPWAGTWALSAGGTTESHGLQGALPFSYGEGMQSSVNTNGIDHIFQPTNTHTQTHTHTGILHRASCLAKVSHTHSPIGKVRDLKTKDSLGQGALWQFEPSPSSPR